MQQYDQYAFLWLQNQNETFDSFLDGRFTPNAKREKIQSRTQESSPTRATTMGATTRATSMAESERESHSSRATSRQSQRLTSATGTRKSSAARMSPTRRTAFTDENDAGSTEMLSMEKEFLKQGRKGAKQQADSSEQKKQGADANQNLPSLYEFETEIEVYQVLNYDYENDYCELKVL